MELIHKFEIFAENFQFILMDESSEDDFSAVWNDEASERMLAIGETSVCLGTLRNITVPIAIHVSQTEPQINIQEFDHAVSASLSIPSGRLATMSCTDYLPNAVRIELPAGIYHLMYLVTGVDSITDETEPADDHYIIHIWPGSPQEPTLLKHWRSHI